MRVLLVAPPYAGHLNPLLVLAGAVPDAEVLVVTGPAKLAAARAAGFEAAPVLPDDPDALEGIANTPKVTGHPIRALRQVTANFRVLPRALPDVQAAADSFGPEVIVADFCAPIAGVVADRLGVPWVTTIPTPFAIENRRGTPAYLGGWTPPRGPLGRARDAVGRRLVRGGKHLAGAVFRRDLAAFGGSLYRADGSEAFYSPDAILALGLRELEFDRDWPAAVQFIGPVVEAPAPALVEPVETAAPPPVELFETPRDLVSTSSTSEAERRVLVTLGTHLPWAKRDLVTQVVRLAERLPDHRFVVALGDASGDRTPTRVTPNVEAVDWLPYDQSLAEFDMVVHHGGAGITYSTLRAGLPSVVWPQDYDQFDFAARITWHGLGVRIRSLREAPDALAAALALPSEPINRFAEGVRRSDPATAFRLAISQPNSVTPQDRQERGEPVTRIPERLRRNYNP